MRVVVYHGGYGCDTGCCGHWVEVGPTSVPHYERSFHFEFDHAGEDPLAFAKQLVTKTYGANHVADLDWDECKIVSYDDCSGA